jgi:peptidylprolyl isomerase
VKIVTILLLVVCLYSIQVAQPITLKEREVLQLQDQRSGGNGKLLSYLQDQNIQLRYLAAIALANLQDTATIRALTVSLKDSAKIVRTASAFALGQMRDERAADELLSAITTEHDSDVIAEIGEALGKCGSQKCLDSLLNICEQKSVIFPQKEFALCIARFAIRQISTERSIWKCFEYAASESPELCSTALFALWRSSPNGLVDLEISKHREELLLLANNPYGDIRMHLATLLGRSKSKDSRELLDTLERAEMTLDDWRVWTQIIRARAALAAATEDMVPRYLGYLSSKNDHIKITALQGLKASPSPMIDHSLLIDTLRVTLCGMVNNGIEVEAVRGEALGVLGKHFPKELDSYQSWLSKSHVTPWLQARLVEGIAQQITKEHLLTLCHNLNHESNRVAMAAWDFIRPMLSPPVLLQLRLDSNEYRLLPKDIFKEAKNALAKNDMGLTTVVANLFADTMVFKIFKDEGLSNQIVDAFIDACRHLPQVDDGEAKQAILQTLGNIHEIGAIPFLEKELLGSEGPISAAAAASLNHMTGKDYSTRIHQGTIKGRTEKEWNLLESIKPHQHVSIITNRGEITLELLKDHAPFTVLNFVKLIKNKFYDGLIFHRVVPNFVVQGGDPRGDGWGGPGYSIRTEISLVKYERGSCGMASAGKDTEGSQFFITHSATPHLDGRYTIFAKVIKGMDVVDRLQIGDTMKTIQLPEE